MPISKVNRKGIASDAQNYTIDTFTGDGSTVAFTLSQDPVSDTDLIVAVGGVLQAPTTNYTLSGTTLTFTGAPDSTIPIMVTHLTYREGAKEFTPDDGSVTTAKLADGVVTSAKLDTNIDIAGTLDVTGNIIADNRIGINEASPTHLLDMALPSGQNGPMIRMTRSENAYNIHLGVTSDSDFAIYDNAETEMIRFMNQGGISFDNGSNYLDDYEEGTFQVKINVGGDDSSTASTCRYVKIGRMVMVEMQNTNSNSPYFLDDTSNQAAGNPVRISTATGYGQLPFVPVSTGGGIMSFTRGVRSQDGDAAAGQTFSWGWLKDSAQLYVGRVTTDGNEYNVWDGNNSSDNNVTLEKDSSVSNVVMSAQFVYYTDD